MSKYSNKLKLKVIKYYLKEHHSYSEYCKKFNITSSTSDISFDVSFISSTTYFLPSNSASTPLSFNHSFICITEFGFSMLVRFCSFYDVSCFAISSNFIAFPTSSISNAIPLSFIS